MRMIFIDNRISRKYEVGSGTKKIIYFLLLLTGCAERSPYKYYNVYTLVEPAAIRNGIKQPPNYDKEFEDDRISIKFTIKEKKVLFKLKNKTDKKLTILWDKASFVDTKGVSHRVVGFENLFTDKMDKETSQTIRAKGDVNDLIVPLENVEFMEEWTWYVRPLFNRTDEFALENRGKIFSISLPVEVAGDTVNYSYKFRIEHVIPHVTWIQ